MSTDLELAGQLSELQTELETQKTHLKHAMEQFQQQSMEIREVVSLVHKVTNAMVPLRERVQRLEEHLKLLGKSPFQTCKKCGRKLPCPCGTRRL